MFTFVDITQLIMSCQLRKMGGLVITYSCDRCENLQAFS